MIVHLFFSSRRRHTRWPRDWSSDVCSSDLKAQGELARVAARLGLSLGEFNMLLALNSRLGLAVAGTTRSEERRVGKELRSLSCALDRKMRRGCCDVSDST